MSQDDPNMISLNAGALLERPRLVPLAGLQRKLDSPQFSGVIQELQAAAAEDKHAVVAPTHIMMKGEKILGYLSLGGLPIVHAWFDTKHPHALDSLKMIETGEAIFAHGGVNAYGVLCAEDSPFARHMERMGFHKLGTTVLYLKNI